MKFAVTRKLVSHPRSLSHTLLSVLTGKRQLLFMFTKIVLQLQIILLCLIIAALVRRLVIRPFILLPFLASVIANHRCSQVCLLRANVRRISLHLMTQTRRQELTYPMNGPNPALLSLQVPLTLSLVATLRMVLLVCSTHRTQSMLTESEPQDLQVTMAMYLLFNNQEVTTNGRQMKVVV